jgi:hypothetical protein
MEDLSPRNPLNEIIRKFGIGCILSFVFIIIYLLMSGTEFTPDVLTLTFFIFGGIFFIIGGVRDFLESVIYKVIRGRGIEKVRDSIDKDYLYGFGKAGEDVIAGFLLIILSVIISSIRL